MLRTFANQAQNELKLRRIRHQGKAIYVNTAAQITLVKAQNRAQNEPKHPCSDEEHQHRHTFKGIRMLMYFVLHVTAQIPMGKAQNQAQNALKRLCLGHQGICSM